jgi:hypothetical protein
LSKPADHQDGATQQVAFIRSDIAALMGIGMDYQLRRDQLIHIVGEHRSCSIVLPVFELYRPDWGLRLILRNNFYNWKLTVLSEQPIVADLSRLCFVTPPLDPEYTGNELADCYFEGFPKELIRSYYTENIREWSAEIQNNCQLWTVVYLLLVSLDRIPRMERPKRLEG